MEGPDVIVTESSSTSITSSSSSNSSSSSIWLSGLTAVSSSGAIGSATSPPDFKNSTTLDYSNALWQSALLGSVILVTIVGNILVCVAVFLVKKLRKPCNYLLVSLAVSDLCVAMLVEPIAMLYEIQGSWSFGPTICELWVSFDVFCCTASILNLCMISVDRYYAISKPLDYGVKRTTRRMIIYVALVWLGAACISLPPLLVLGNEYGIDEKTGMLRCLVCQNFGYQIYATLFSFYIPLFIMMMVYYQIFRAARKIVLEEKSARSHLEAYCHVDIDHQQLGLGSTTQQKLESGSGQAAERHRNSSASTTCSSKCFAGGPRKSNESQCPMLLACSAAEKQPILGTTPTTTTMTTTTTGPLLQARDYRLPPGSRHRRQKVNSTSSEAAAAAASSPHKQKRLRLQLAKERKASTTLGIIMSAFTICWLPFFVLTVVRICLKDPDAIPDSLSSVFLWLGYCNSLLNPVIYATLNRDFRKPFREILYFRCGNLQHMMREEFYQSQYGNPINKYAVRSANHESLGAVVAAAAAAATASGNSAGADAGAGGGGGGGGGAAAAATSTAETVQVQPETDVTEDLAGTDPPGESFL